MNSLPRSSLFPLIVIVLLVYLASQTLVGDGKDPSRLAYSRLVARVQREPAAFRTIVFRPDRRDIRAELVVGGELEASYPTPRSQVEFEDLLIKNGVTYDFDWSDREESAWRSLLTALLPFVLLFGFWLFLTKQQRDRTERA